MKWLLVVCVVGCTSEIKKTSLEGAIDCGPASCGSGQICYSEESGEQCLVNPDAGIGQYQEFGWTCGPLPADCDGVTQDCFTDRWTQVSADGRHVTQLCI